jgi:hypothetical protein
VTPGRDDELEGAIRRLLGDPHLCSRLGESAWQTVHDRYTADRVASAYATVFADLLDRGHDPEPLKP